MSKSTQFTWRWIATQVIKGPFDREIYEEAWVGAKAIAWAIMVLFVRLAIFVMAPVTIPALVAFFRVMGPINERRRAARYARRKKAMDDDV